MDNVEKVNPEPKRDPGDFVAEERRIGHPNYVGVFIFLALLTALEVAIVGIRLPELGIDFHIVPATPGRVPLLLTLTVAKGLLVVLYYMHLKFDSKLYSWFFGAGIFAFAVPFVIALILMMSPPTLESVRAGEERPTGGEVAARPTRNPNAGPPITYELEASEFLFKPDSISANSGQRVTIALKNVGSVEHNFALADKPKSEDREPWLTNAGKVIVTAQPGKTTSRGFTAPTPGEWVFYCSIPGHAAAGMVGTLTVQ